MKKITLLTAALTSAIALGGNALPVNAASNQNVRIGSNRCQIIIKGQSLTECKDLLSQLQNCIPGITVPVIQCPQKPDQPEQGTPDTTQPSPEVPAPEVPEELPSPEIPDTEQPDQDNSADSYINQVVSLLNRERIKEGLDPLTINENAQAAAQVRAKEIVTSFSHTRPDGSSFATALKEQNVNYRRAGENIAWGQKSPQEVVNAWMNSEGHRANIMNSGFTQIGVGHYQVNGINYWCQLFIG